MTLTGFFSSSPDYKVFFILHKGSVLKIQLDNMCVFWTIINGLEELVQCISISLCLPLDLFPFR